MSEDRIFHVRRVEGVPVEAAILYAARDCASSPGRFRDELEAEGPLVDGIFGRRQAQFWEAELRLKELIPELLPLVVGNDKELKTELMDRMDMQADLDEATGERVGCIIEDVFQDRAARR